MRNEHNKHDQGSVLLETKVRKILGATVLIPVSKEYYCEIPVSNNIIVKFLYQKNEYFSTSNLPNIQTVWFSAPRIRDTDYNMFVPMRFNSCAWRFLLCSL